MGSELSHMARVTTLGELTASIAHEVRQPLAAMVFNAGAAVRWLGRSPPNVGEAQEAARGVIRDGERADAVVARLRSLFKKAETTQVLVDLNEVDLREKVLALTRVESPEARRRLSTCAWLKDCLQVLGDRGSTAAGGDEPRHERRRGGPRGQPRRSRGHGLDRA